MTSKHKYMSKYALKYTTDTEMTSFSKNLGKKLIGRFGISKKWHFERRSVLLFTENGATSIIFGIACSHFSGISVLVQFLFDFYQPLST